MPPEKKIKKSFSTNVFYTFFSFFCESTFIIKKNKKVFKLNDDDDEETKVSFLIVF